MDVLECSMRNRKQSNRKPIRQGMTALLAMLYLALIASLAVGFYASTNSAAMPSSGWKPDATVCRNPTSWGCRTSR